MKENMEEPHDDQISQFARQEVRKNLLLEEQTARVIATVKSLGYNFYSVAPESHQLILLKNNPTRKPGEERPNDLIKPIDSVNFNKFVSDALKDYEGLLKNPEDIIRIENLGNE